MQKRNEETFGDISGVHVIADDLIIAAATEQEHDTILRKVLDRARDNGVRFNYDKIQFKVSEVEYMGNLVSSKGLKPDPKKVEAIVDMPMPTDVPSLQRLLGMIKYLAQYIPNESIITAPLLALLKKEVGWNWTFEHDSTMNKLREVLTSKPVLAYYDVTKPVMIQADASVRLRSMPAPGWKSNSLRISFDDFCGRKLCANRERNARDKLCHEEISPVYLRQAGHSRTNRSQTAEEHPEKTYV